MLGCRWQRWRVKLRCVPADAFYTRSCVRAESGGEAANAARAWGLPGMPRADFDPKHSIISCNYSWSITRLLPHDLSRAWHFWIYLPCANLSFSKLSTKFCWRCYVLLWCTSTLQVCILNSGNENLSVVSKLWKTTSAMWCLSYELWCFSISIQQHNLGKKL